MSDLRKELYITAGRGAQTTLIVRYSPNIAAKECTCCQGQGQV